MFRLTDVQQPMIERIIECGMLPTPSGNPLLMAKEAQTEEKRLIADLIHAIVTCNVEIGHHLPPFGDINVDIA